MLNSEIRSKILKERWLLPPPTKTKYDHTIYLKTLTFIKNKSIKNYIGLYWPIEGEVDTIALIDELLRLKYRVCLPYIENKKMVYKQIKNTNFDCEFWKNMRQPLKSFLTIKPKQIDLLIVPLIAFNDSNHRLGYGLNFFNNYLIKNDTDAVGLAYSFQHTNNFKITNKDISLKRIITN